MNASSVCVKPGLCPGHACLGGLLTHCTSHSWHLGLQFRLILEKVQVPPRARQAVMDRLLRRLTGGTIQAPGWINLEADQVLQQDGSRRLPRATVN